MNKAKVAIATTADSRSDFYAQREYIVNDELSRLSWLTEPYETLVTPVLRSPDDVAREVRRIKSFGADALIIHLPIWADPEFALELARGCALPVLLKGNDLPSSSSLVAMLGAGGALDQSGVSHTRVYSSSPGDIKKTLSFVNAAGALNTLRGEKLVRFGGRSLGIVTADVDYETAYEAFGVKIEQHEESEIITEAENIGADEASALVSWLKQRMDIVFGDGFNPEILERQARSYLALKKLVKKYEADMVGIKCQREMSDGYAAQCLSHMLMNSAEDERGEKPPVACACESDCGGAITMRILTLLSRAPSCLLDIRRFIPEENSLTLANCGACPWDMLDSSRRCVMCRHTFGTAGAGAFAGEIKTGAVTLARLCVRDGRFWLAAAKGESVPMPGDQREAIPKAFPSALVKCGFDSRFLAEFGSNHIHLVFGDYLEDLKQFCYLAGIRCVVW